MDDADKQEEWASFSPFQPHLLVGLLLVGQPSPPVTEDDFIVHFFTILCSFSSTRSTLWAATAPPAPAITPSLDTVAEAFGSGKSLHNDPESKAVSSMQL